MDARHSRFACRALASGVALLAFLGTIAAACAADSGAQRVAVAHFTALRVEGPADLTLTQGPEESLTVDMSRGRGTPVRIEEENGRLTLRNVARGNWWDRLFGHNLTPRIALTFRDLRSIDLRDAVRLRVDGLRGSSLAVHASGQANLALLRLDADDLTIDSSGAVRANVSGRVHQQKIVISGAGVYHGADLRSDDARVLVTGAGRVTVHARDTLDVSVSGAGKVEYLGDPKVTKRVTGAARIERRGSSSARDT